MVSTIFTAGFCVCGALFSVFKYYKTPQYSFFFYFSVVCFFLCFRVLSLIDITPFNIENFDGIIAGLLIVSFYVFIYSFLEDVSAFLKKILILGGIFFLIYIIASLFNLKAIINFLRPLGIYVDTFLVVAIGITVFSKKQKYMRFIQLGLLLLALIALLVYLPRITNISLPISQTVLLQVEAILGISMFQFSMIIKEKEEEEKLALAIEKKVIEHQKLEKRIKQIKENNIKKFILFNNTKIDLETLIYICSDGHYLQLYTTTNKKLIRGKISEIREELPSNFIQTHRSYIINSNYVKDVFSNFIMMKDKVEIPISRSKKGMVKNKLS